MRQQRCVITSVASSSRAAASSHRHEISALTGVGEACLTLKRARPALAATRRATELHRAHDLAALDGMSPHFCGGHTVGPCMPTSRPLPRARRSRWPTGSCARASAA